MLELSSLESDLSLELQSRFLSISLSDLSLFVGISFSKDPFGLLLRSLLSLGLVGLSLDSLDALLLLRLHDSDLHLGLGGDLDLLEVDLLQSESVSEVIHLLLVLLLQCEHSLVVLIQHAYNHILYNI